MISRKCGVCGKNVVKKAVFCIKGKVTYHVNCLGRTIGEFEEIMNYCQQEIGSRTLVPELAIQSAQNIGKQQLLNISSLLRKLTNEVITNWSKTRKNQLFAMVFFPTTVLSRG